MNVRVEPNRFLSVACEPDERIVFDRKETKYHLLRDSAARLWDDICEGGTFEVAAGPDGNEPLTLLAEAGLIGIDDDASSEGITRRVWLRRTGKVSAAAVVLPLVASITTPRLVLGQVPSLEEEITQSKPLSESPLSESPIVESNQGSERMRASDRKELKKESKDSGEETPTPAGTENNGDNGTRTRRRTRTGQQTLTTSETEAGPKIHTRRRDR